MNSQELWENDLVQINGNTYTAEAARNLNRYPGTPHVNLEPLPKCQCEKDVKPGEDSCWECLGEKPEPELIWLDNSYTITSNTIVYPLLL